MNSATAAALLALNHQFYQTFASPFSATRQRIQPGVQRLFPLLLKAHRLVDLGCGNGELARRLVQQGFTGHYAGVDFSPGLLASASQVITPGASVSFLPADLSQPGWEAVLPPGPYDLVSAFAVLHHLPGTDLRRRLLRTVWDLLAPGGLLALSNWQFLNSPRLRQRIQPWANAGLSPEQLDPGDYLLDWRHGGSGLRYVHHFSREELELEAAGNGYVVIESFLSDGVNGQTGLYQIWQKPD